MTAPGSRRAADNPFTSERIEALALRPRDWTWDALLDRLERMAFRAAVVGPHGSGKTTLLRELGKRLGNRASVVRISTDDPRPVAVAFEHVPPRAISHPIVLVDGSERLGPVAWWRLCVGWRRAAGIVASRHTPGRLPTLVAMRTDVSLLRDLVAELAPDDVARLEGHLEGLFLRHDGNIRSCLRALYDLYAGR